MYYRIHLYRSFIGMPQTIRETCKALGLRKTGNVVYRKVSPQIAGQVVKVKELVRVNLVESIEIQQAELLSRKSSPGYSVIGKA